LLAEAIPALSLPVGANIINSIPHSGPNNVEFNMPAAFVIPNGSSYFWPSERPIDTDVTPNLPSWHHSDMHDVAYPYTYNFYNQLANISKQ
jgi:hypothetical protein